MADPIGISFIPTADAAANGPRQASLEGQGGSDLAAAFKILSLHLPTVLGAKALAPKRLLTSPGASGVPLPAGMSVSAQVFQSLLQSLGGGAGGGGAGGGDAGGVGGGSDVAALSSLFGGGSTSAAGPSAVLDAGSSSRDSSAPYGGNYDTFGGGFPAPNIKPGGGYDPNAWDPSAVVPSPSSPSMPEWPRGAENRRPPSANKVY